MTARDINPTTRFSHTVEQYVKYRPHYPSAIMDLLKEACGLQPGAVVADMGSGTGIFAKLLLDHHIKVLGVEPNVEMRKKSEELLSYYPNFTSLNATAEATPLEAHSVAGVTVATAFHWFDRESAKREFQRILKSDGFCFLVWNVRDTHVSPLMKGYEALFDQYGIHYKHAAARRIADSRAYVRQFFRPAKGNATVFSNQQVLDEQGFLGRLLSSSHSPKSGHPNHTTMIQAARRLFSQHQEAGCVKLYYRTECYYGHFKV